MSLLPTFCNAWLFTWLCWGLLIWFIIIGPCWADTKFTTFLVDWGTYCDIKIGWETIRCCTNTEFVTCCWVTCCWVEFICVLMTLFWMKLYLTSFLWGPLLTKLTVDRFVGIWVTTVPWIACLNYCGDIIVGFLFKLTRLYVKCWTFCGEITWETFLTGCANKGSVSLR